MTAKQGSMKIALPMTLLSVIIAPVVCLLFVAEFAFAVPFELSPDGYAVVRLTPQGTVSASTLDTSLLTPGFTSATGTGGSLSVTSYTAAFASGMGGAEIKALYDRGGPLSAGQSLEWVQVITTNAPLGGATSPYLDNAGKPGAPFYTFTAQNKDPTLPANKLNFYDFSKRDPATLTTVSPIKTWNANLYPVISDGAQGITVQNGISWGWSMKKAMVGSDPGVFVNPAPATAVTFGVGTNTFGWGSGDPSFLRFIGESFDTKPNTPFTLGHLTFHNGAIFEGTGADSVTLNVSMNFDNVSEKNFVFPINFQLVNTLNTDDPFASADFVGIEGFSFTFEVFEGATASADILAVLSTGLSALPSGAVPTGAELSGLPFDPSGNYRLSIVGFANPSPGGFIGGSVPEPSTLLLLSLGLIAALTVRRRSQ